MNMYELPYPLCFFWAHAMQLSEWENIRRRPNVSHCACLHHARAIAGFGGLSETDATLE